MQPTTLRVAAERQDESKTGAHVPQSVDNAGDELERAFALTLRDEAGHVVARGSEAPHRELLGLLLPAGGQA